MVCPAKNCSYGHRACTFADGTPPELVTCIHFAAMGGRFGLSIQKDEVVADIQYDASMVN